LFPPPAGDVHAWVGSLEGGSTAPFATSADGTMATLFWRSGPDERERAAKSFSDVLQSSLGTRVPAADQTKLAEHFEHVAKARAGWALVSITAGASPGVLARLATNDAALLTTSIEGAIDVVRKPAWEPWEKDFGLTKIDRGAGHATFTTAQGPLQATWATHGG